jgi:hypothetical protein
VLRPANNFTKPFEFGEDRIGGGGPGEGPGMRVPVFDEALDVAAQISGGSERAAADGLARDLTEPDLDLIEARSCRSG